MRALDGAPQEQSLSTARAEKRIGSSSRVDRVTGIKGEQGERMRPPGIIARDQQLPVRLQRGRVQNASNAGKDRRRRQALAPIRADDQPAHLINVLRDTHDELLGGPPDSVAYLCFGALPDRLERRIERDPISVAKS